MPIGKTMRQTRPHPRGKVKATAGPAAGGFVNIVSATAASKVVTVTFDQAVVVSRTPAWAIDGQLPSASRLTGPTTLELTYPSVVAIDEPMTVAYEPSAVCGLTGGTVPPQQVVPTEAAASSMSLAPAAEKMAA